ncbi:MAG: phosphoadenylyl-sulfate reductase [Planctomycetota bacterium]
MNEAFKIHDASAIAAERSAVEVESDASLPEISGEKPSPQTSRPQLRVLTVAEIEETRALEQQEEPSEAFLTELERESLALEKSSPKEILAWAIDRYAPKFSMATAFGPEGMTIIHMLAEIAPDTPIFNLDTGYQFQETLELREEVKRRYGIEVELKKPELTVEAYELANGGPVYKTDPGRCCGDRKLSVLKKAAGEFDACASAIRRDQSPDRAKASIVGWDKKFGLVKVSPLANWTKKDVWGLIAAENIPYNPLHDKGYPSVGCWPCTRSVLPGEDERAGRWSGFAKTECGLHTSN